MGRLNDCIKVKYYQLEMKKKSTPCIAFALKLSPYQTLLAQQTEQHGIAHFSQVLETHRLELSVLNDVLELVVEEFQDT